MNISNRKKLEIGDAVQKFYLWEIDRIILWSHCYTHTHCHWISRWHLIIRWIQKEKCWRISWSLFFPEMKANEIQNCFWIWQISNCIIPDDSVPAELPLRWMGTERSLKTAYSWQTSLHIAVKSLKLIQCAAPWPADIQPPKVLSPLLFSLCLIWMGSKNFIKGNHHK